MSQFKEKNHSYTVVNIVLLCWFKYLYASPFKNREMSVCIYEILGRYFQYNLKKERTIWLHAKFVLNVTETQMPCAEHYL